MKTPSLLTVPKTGLSKREQITAFKLAHGIKTHCAPKDVPDRWLALIPFDEDKGKDIGLIMAESCRLYDESGYCAIAKGELSAVRNLCKQLHISCPL